MKLIKLLLYWYSQSLYLYRVGALNAFVDLRECKRQKAKWIKDSWIQDKHTIYICIHSADCNCVTGRAGFKMSVGDVNWLQPLAIYTKKRCVYTFFKLIYIQCLTQISTHSQILIVFMFHYSSRRCTQQCIFLASSSFTNLIYYKISIFQNLLFIKCWPKKYHLLYFIR